MEKKKRNKFSIEDREQAVLMVLKEYRSIFSVARQLGTSPTHVSRWVKNYQHQGKSGLSLKNNMYYDGDLKLSILQDMSSNHLSLSQISLKYGITDTLISKWRRQYEQNGISSLNTRKTRGRPSKMKEEKVRPEKKKVPLDPNQELLDENLRLRIENAYLKKLQALTQKAKGQKPSKS